MFDNLTQMKYTQPRGLKRAGSRFSVLSRPLAWIEVQPREWARKPGGQADLNFEQTKLRDTPVPIEAADDDHRLSVIHHRADPIIRGYLRRKAVKKVGFLCLVLAVCGVAQQSELKVGVGVVDITGPGAVVLDPLNVKALVFRQGPEQFAIVECDQTGVSAAMTQAARSEAAAKTGIPYANICVAATHTHMASPHKDLIPAVVKAIVDAQAAAVPVKLEAGLGVQYTISFNRRYFMKNGTVVFNPMFLNPDIVRPAGPIDPEVGILLMRNAVDGRPVMSLTNFALHADTVKEYGAVYQNTGPGSRDSVSADFPYWLEEGLRKDFGQAFKSVFITGTCGNINHWDFSKPGPQSGHKTTTKFLGDSLSASVKAALPKLKEVRPDLAARSRTLNVPLRVPSAEEVAWAQQTQKTPLSSKSEEMTERQAFLTRVRMGRILSVERQRKASGTDTTPLDVQVFRLSQATAIVTLPCEIFVEHGMTIKNLSPFENTLIVTLANTTCGYVPNRKAYAQGEYEVETATLAPGGGEMMVEAAVQMLHELKKDFQ